MEKKELLMGTKAEIIDHLIDKKVYNMTIGDYPSLRKQLEYIHSGFAILYLMHLKGETPYWTHDPEPETWISPIYIFIRP